jgi:cytochrome o ubiquinol oxidase subunit 2
MKKKTRLAFLGLWLPYAVLLSGCNVALLDPKGPIGEGNRLVILVAVALMLLVVIPVFIMAFWFSRKYRASNTNATYMPKWSYSPRIDLVVWLVPVAIVTALGILAWVQTHRLDPYRPIDTSARSISIEAVSLDWKWLFIYPEYNIATVNRLVFPARVPLSFRITSDTVMTSFFIPQLGSQIYAMAGMQTWLHLMADGPGVYFGQNQQLSGRGYADMSFKAVAVSQDQFQRWIQRARQSTDKLDLARFEEIAKPSVGHAVTYFSFVRPDLFDQIISKYRPARVNPRAAGKRPVSTHMDAWEAG